MPKKKVDQKRRGRKKRKKDALVAINAHMAATATTQDAVEAPTQPPATANGSTNDEGGRKAPLPMPVRGQKAPKDTLLVAGKEQQKQILDEYEETYGKDYPHSIVSKSKGENEHCIAAAPKAEALSSEPAAKKGRLEERATEKKRRRTMAPRLSISYRVDDLRWYNIIAIVIKRARPKRANNGMRVEGFLCEEDITSLSLTSKLWRRIVPQMLTYFDVDATPLKEPRLDYAEQDAIDPQRVAQHAAAFLNSGLDPGKLVRNSLNDEYTGAYRDETRALLETEGLVDEDDRKHLKRVIRDGCPMELDLWETQAEKLASIERGNQKSFAGELVKAPRGRRRNTATGAPNQMADLYGPCFMCVAKATQSNLPFFVLTQRTSSTRDACSTRRSGTATSCPCRTGCASSRPLQGTTPKG